MTSDFVQASATDDNDSDNNSLKISLPRFLSQHPSSHFDINLNTAHTEHSGNFAHNNNINNNYEDNNMIKGDSSERYEEINNSNILNDNFNNLNTNTAYYNNNTNMNNLNDCDFFDDFSSVPALEYLNSVNNNNNNSSSLNNVNNTSGENIVNYRSHTNNYDSLQQTRPLYSPRRYHNSDKHDMTSMNNRTDNNKFGRYQEQLGTNNVVTSPITLNFNNYYGINPNTNDGNLFHDGNIITPVLPVQERTTKYENRKISRTSSNLSSANKRSFAAENAVEQNSTAKRSRTSSDTAVEGNNHNVKNVPNLTHVTSYSRETSKTCSNQSSFENACVVQNYNLDPANTVNFWKRNENRNYQVQTKGPGVDNKQQQQRYEYGKSTLGQLAHINSMSLSNISVTTDSSQARSGRMSNLAKQSVQSDDTKRLRWSEKDIRNLWISISKHGNEWTDVFHCLQRVSAQVVSHPADGTVSVVEVIDIERTYHQVKDKGRRLLQQHKWKSGRFKQDYAGSCEEAKNIALEVLRTKFNHNKTEPNFEAE